MRRKKERSSYGARPEDHQELRRVAFTLVGAVALYQGIDHPGKLAMGRFE
ncbi:hypothetical protein ABZ714_08305 [Streptomyces sp. NPDC006798]